MIGNHKEENLYKTKGLFLKYISTVKKGADYENQSPYANKIISY